MFHLSDFLIYCFITAYTPGANNLFIIHEQCGTAWLSPQLPLQSWYTGRVFRCHDGLYGLQHNAVHPSAQIKVNHAVFRGGVYALPCMEGLKKPGQSKCGRQ